MRIASSFALGGTLGLLLALCCGVRAAGPLRVHPDNPRYFTDDSGRAVYLTGAHTWLDLQDYSYAWIDPVSGTEVQSASLRVERAGVQKFVRVKNGGHGLRPTRRGAQISPSRAALTQLRDAWFQEHLQVARKAFNR